MMILLCMEHGLELEHLGTVKQMGHVTLWILFRLESWYPLNLVMSLQLIWKLGIDT